MRMLARANRKKPFWLRDGGKSTSRAVRMEDRRKLARSVAISQRAIPIFGRVERAKKWSAHPTAKLFDALSDHFGGEHSVLLGHHLFGCRFANSDEHLI